MATPAYLAASPGYPAQAGLLTQFTGAHTSQWLYSGALQTQQATGTGLYQSLQSLAYAETFTTGAAQSAIGSVGLQISTIGGSPLTATISPLTVALYAVAAGVPTGAPLASTTLLEQYVYNQPFWCTVPLPVTGLTPSTPYALVVSGTGSAGAYYVWQCSDQPSGAATSPDAVTWSAQGYGLMYQVYDDSVTAGSQIQAMIDDGGARITTFAWSGTVLTGITEYTRTQSGAGLVSTRALTYAGNGLLTGVG